MPSRWWVPVTGVSPERVTLEQVHGAISSWFDNTPGEHAAAIKPYSVSPLSGASPQLGIEVSVLTPEAVTRLRQSAIAGGQIRLGGQIGRLGTAIQRAEQSWDALSVPTGAHSWELEFLTPTTFRRRDRSSPWPAPAAVLRGLSESWGAWSQLPRRDLTHQDADSVWVSDMAGQSHPMTLAGTRISGFVGRVRYQCDDPTLAVVVDPLFRLAPFCGVGSAKAKGLGVTRLRSIRQPQTTGPSSRAS